MAKNIYFPFNYWVSEFWTVDYWPVLWSAEHLENKFVVSSDDRNWSVATETRKIVVPAEVRTFDVE